MLTETGIKAARPIRAWALWIVVSGGLVAGCHPDTHGEPARAIKVPLCTLISDWAQFVDVEVSAEARLVQPSFELMLLTESQCPGRSIPFLFTGGVRGRAANDLVPIFSFEAGRPFIDTTRRSISASFRGRIRNNSSTPVFEIEDVSAFEVEPPTQ